MAASDRAQADALDRIWEALAGRPSEPVRPGELDPRDETLPARLMDLERLAMRRSTPVPDWATVRDRIQPSTAPALIPPVRRIWPFMTIGRRTVRSTRGRSWWPALELAMGATAILVLLGIVYGWNLKSIQFWDAPSPTHPAFGDAPAAVGSIEETPTPPGAEPTATAVSTVAPSPTAVPTTVVGTFDPDGDGFMTFEQLSAGIAAVIPQYAWPPDYRVSHELIMAPMLWPNPTSSANSTHQAGGEWTIVGMYHMCAWERTWLDARAAGDEELADEALEQLTEVVPTSPLAAPDWVANRIEVARRAAAGDPSLVIQDVTNTCDMDFLTPEWTLPAAAVELSAPGISWSAKPGFAWSPVEITIPQGGVIRLINDGTGGPHNFVIEGYNDDAPVDMPPGSQTDWTVPADLPPGTYTFYCSIPGHRALMEGTITILPADAGGELSAGR